MRYLFMLSLWAIALGSCRNQQQGNEEAYAVSLQRDVIHVDSESPILSRLTTETVRREPYRMVFTASGVVQAIPSRYAEIASPVSGRITRSFVRLGEKVAPGSPVFAISSPDVYETGKSYLQARQEMELALKSLNRERDLMRNKVGVQKELEEAEVNYELKRKECESMAAALRVFQVNPEEMTLGEPLVVRSPIAGEVVKDRVVMGQYMKEDAEPVVVVADLSKVWVVAHVKEKDLGLVRALDEVEIHLVAMPSKPLSGTIYYISEMLDPDTRSVEVLIECDNADRWMKPEMYGTVKLSDREGEAIRVPTSAILQEEERMYVLISLGNGDYRKQAIESGVTEDGKTVVLTGLSAGDEIVTGGAFYLLDVR